MRIAKFHLLSLLFCIAFANRALAECSETEVQEVATNHPTFRSDINLRGEAIITEAAYKDQFIPKCAVMFSTKFPPVGRQDHCVRRAVIAAAKLDPDAAQDKMLTLWGVDEMQPVQVGLEAYDSNSNPVTGGSDFVTFLKAKDRGTGFDIKIGQKAYHVYIELLYSPKKSSMNVYKRYRLELFDTSDHACMEYVPEKRMVAKKGMRGENPQRFLALASSPLRINETQVGDGSEPKH